MVESEPGIGNRFHFNIKLKKARGTEEKKLPVLFQNAEFERTINILIVEDDEACSSLLCKLLNFNKNINTAIADNENDALDNIGSGGFDIVLMDLNINGVSGIDITQKIRSAGNDVPIIAVSGEAANKIIENCYKAGMNDFITKPFSMNELINKITNLLKRHKRTAGNAFNFSVPL
ncbi:MAG: Sensor protein [uncultured bacterium]|nr:MAG: Sensor protein [uncultured bacterium]